MINAQLILHVPAEEQELIQQIIDAFLDKDGVVSIDASEKTLNVVGQPEICPCVLDVEIREF